jgi:dihydroorotate dehydrogenase subfamily 1
MAEIPGGFLNTELWSELPPERWLEHEYARARESGLPVIISLGYSADDIASLAPRVRPFADALELSTHYIGEDPGPMQQAIRAAKQAVDVPVLVKLSPLGREMVAAAQAAREAGADGLVLINSFGPCLAIDPETAFPLMGGKDGFGWLSGPALKPLALRCIFDVARNVALPILGVGGVSNGTDAVEMMMVGASAVQVCTAAILRGWTVFGRIASQIDTWLDDHGYSAVSEIRGLTARVLKDRVARLRPAIPSLDESLCSGCGLCELSCVYQAIHVVDRGPILDPDLCAGCGLCVTRCRPGALRMAP